MFFYQAKKLLEGRQILYIALTFSVSIVFGGLLCDQVYCYQVVGAFVCALLAVIGAKVIFDKFKNILLFVLLITFCLGVISYSSNRHYLENRFDKLLWKTDTFSAKILSFPKISGELAKYEIGLPDGNANLTVWKNKDLYTVGDVVEIKGRITKPSGARNPGGFDMQKYLMTKGMSGEIFVDSSGIKAVGTYFSNPLITAGYNIKMWIVNSIKRYLPEDKAALLNSMMIGYTDEVDAQTKSDFKDAGLTHLMAVSGMNVAFVILPIVFIAKKMRIRRVRISIIGLAALFLFLFITGFSASIVRACVMGGIILVSKMIDKESDIATSIAFAALVMEIVNPMTVFDIGFQFSFCATIGLVLMSQKFIKRFISMGVHKNLAEVFSVTLAAQLAVMPILINTFNQVSAISFVANTLVVPLVGFVTIVGFILSGVSGLPMIAKPFALLEEAILSFIKGVSEFCASVPGAVWKIPEIGVFGFVVYYFLLWLMFNYKRFAFNKPAVRIIAVTAAVSLLCVSLSLKNPNQLVLTIFDVGQGDSILIRTPKGNNIMVDSGDGKTILSGLLLSMGISRLDALILTHSHLDHVGGVEELKKNIAIGQIIVPNNRTELVFQAQDFVKVQDQEYMDFDGGVKLTFFNPNINEPASGDDVSSNDNSVVTLLSFGSFDALLSGDIGTAVEERLVANGFANNIEILKVAHHGSNYSSSENFLRNFSFQNGIISVGKNLYGHPSPITISRLKASGTNVYRTDWAGAVSISTDGSTYSIICNLDYPTCGRLYYELDRAQQTNIAR